MKSRKTDHVSSWIINNGDAEEKLINIFLFSGPILISRKTGKLLFYFLTHFFERLNALSQVRLATSRHWRTLSAKRDIRLRTMSLVNPSISVSNSARTDTDFVLQEDQK